MRVIGGKLDLYLPKMKVIFQATILLLLILYNAKSKAINFLFFCIIFFCCIIFFKTFIFNLTSFFLQIEWHADSVFISVHLLKLKNQVMNFYFEGGFSVKLAVRTLKEFLWHMTITVVHISFGKVKPLLVIKKKTLFELWRKIYVIIFICI